MHPIEHARTKPAHTAVVMAESGASLTYAEMEDGADRFSQMLRTRGLKAGDAFAVLMENRLDYFPIVWGSQRAGTLLVPISTRLTAPEIAYILQDCETRLLVTSAKYADLLPAILRECPDLKVVMNGASDHPYPDLSEELAAQPEGPIADQSAGQVMLYSSGTTGRPKGVRPPPPETTDVIDRPALVALATMGAGMPADGSMVYLSPAPLYHAAPISWCSTVHRLGGTVVLMEKFDAEFALATIERHGVTDSQWVPTHFVRMLQLPEDVRAGYDLSTHQRAIHAAAPCPVPIKRAMIEWWGPILIEYYAGSEGIGMNLIKSEDWLAHPGSVGKAIFGTMHVCNPDGEEVPPGTDGLVFFENARLPSYHKDPEKTAEARHPQGWMTLGDIGHVDDDGYLYLTDRKSHMIISGGVNIYPQEIENLLIAHEKITDAGVIGVPHPEFGETVVAVVQPVDMELAGKALEQELRDYLAPRLAQIKTPREFHFRAELPREANGKLYKQELKSEFASRIKA